MLEFALIALTYVLPFLVILTIIVTVHEMAHFLMARAFDTAVDTFSIGFGPKIASWRGAHGMEWRISAIPMGGYVKFSGDENAASVPDSDDLDQLRQRIVSEKGEEALNRYFHFKPLWQRAMIVAAGPVSNFILAIAIFAAMLMAFGSVVSPPQVISVETGGPAARAGFMPGDVVLDVNGRPIRQFLDFKMAVAMSSGDPLIFGVRRGAREIRLTAVPERRDMPNAIGGSEKMGAIGVALRPGPGTRIERYGPIEALAGATRQTWDVVRLNVTYIGRWVRGAENGDQIRGPLGMAQATGGVAKLSAQTSGSLAEKSATVALNIINMAAYISVAIGFINLMPIPVLDGGHLLFYGYEAVARRPLGAGIQAAGYRVGLVLILGLVLFATWNDFQQLRVFQIIGGMFS